MNRSRQSLPAYAGFTLIEIIVTIIITAIAFTSLLVWMVNANRHSVDPLLSTKAAELGQAYLEEILAKRFDENTSSGGVTRCTNSGAPLCSATLGAESGETRAQFDDVDDYHNVIDNGALNALGAPRANYTDFQVGISVSYAGGDFSLPSDAIKRIVVIVRHPVAGEFQFSAYRGNF